MNQEIGLPQTLEDFLAARDKALAELDAAIAHLNNAEGAIRTKGLPGGLASPLHRLDREDQRKHIDRQFWSQAFDSTGFRRLMDRQAVRDFNKDLEKDCPAFTRENVIATFGELFQERDTLWMRGVANVFARLSPAKKSHDSFKIQRRMVMNSMLHEHWGGKGLTIAIGGRYHGASHEIDDLDRVLCQIEGAEHEPRALEHRLNEAFQDEPFEYEDARMKVRGFRNGNLHLYLRADLVDAVNRVLARYYEGDAVAHRRGAA